MYARDATLAGVAGKFDLDVTPAAAAETFDIRAVGHSIGATPLTRSIETTVRLTRATPKLAAGFGAAVVVPQNNTVNGLLVANGAVTTSGGGVINGTVRQTPLSSDYVIPMNTSQIYFYGTDVAGGTYTMSDGTVGTPQALASPLLSAAPAANAGNPGRVFYYNGSVVTNGGMTFNGTLIVRGTLQIRGPGTAITTRITPQPGFPALIVQTDLYMNQNNVTFIADGVVWVGGRSTWGTHSGSSVTVNGAMLMPTVNALSASANGSLALHYNASNVNVTNLTTAQQPVVGVKFLSWKQ
jgi:hypothetical protein